MDMISGHLDVTTDLFFIPFTCLKPPIRPTHPLSEERIITIFYVVISYFVLLFNVIYIIIFVIIMVTDSVFGCLGGSKST